MVMIESQLIVVQEAEVDVVVLLFPLVRLSPLVRRHQPRTTPVNTCEAHTQEAGQAPQQLNTQQHTQQHNHHHDDDDQLLDRHTPLGAAAAPTRW
jgi:hypothetical protein